MKRVIATPDGRGAIVQDRPPASPKEPHPLAVGTATQNDTCSADAAQLTTWPERLFSPRRVQRWQHQHPIYEAAYQRAIVLRAHLRQRIFDSHHDPVVRARYETACRLEAVMRKAARATDVAFHVDRYERLSAWDGACPVCCGDGLSQETEGSATYTESRTMYFNCENCGGTGEKDFDDSVCLACDGQVTIRLRSSAWYGSNALFTTRCRGCSDCMSRDTEGEGYQDYCEQRLGRGVL